MVEFQITADLTIPADTLIERNSPFAKSWQLHTSGKESWAGCTLVYCGGSIQASVDQMPIPPTNPGDSAVIEINLTAPSNFGGHAACWYFHEAAGQKIGKPLLVKFQVAGRRFQLK